MRSEQITADIVKDEFGGDMVKIIESIFRVRTTEGRLIDYKMVEPHRKMLRTGLLGDKSALLRVVNKGRQGGFSTFLQIENISIASLMPNTYQYYVATKEQTAKNWLRRLEKIAKDARLWFDGSRIIDLDTNSTHLEKIFKHFPKDVKRDIEYSYIVGLAASPGGIRGESAINIDLDEFAFNIRVKNQQRDVLEAIKYFISQGGQMTMQSTPLVKTDLFWEIYTKAEERMFTRFYFPIIENWQELDLTKPLFMLTTPQRRKTSSYPDRLVDEERQRLINSGLYEEKELLINRVKKRVWSQKMKIPYYWIDVGVLEMSRRDDLEYFKQEVLGVPADVMHRFITPELVDERAVSREKYENDGSGIYGMAIDVAQKRDLLSITVGEFDNNGVIWERWIEESQEWTPIQFDLVKELALRYKPMEIRIDNTGVGIALGDLIENDPEMPPLRRIEFGSSVELPAKKLKMTEFLAIGFKRALQNGKYNMLNHRYANQHVLGIEKIPLESGGVRYSGKRSEIGRDDHFWSKAMLNANFGFALKNPAFSTLGGKTFISVPIMKRKKLYRSPLLDAPTNNSNYIGW